MALVLSGRRAVVQMAGFGLALFGVVEVGFLLSTSMAQNLLLTAFLVVRALVIKLRAQFGRFGRQREP